MNITHFAVAETSTEESQNLFAALGIDVQLLVVQAVSFLILFLLLRKFVFPAFLKVIDDREAKIADSVKAAEEASKAAERAEENTEAELKKAKQEAADIIAIAQKEASGIVEDAESRATKKAEHLIEQAQSRLETDVAEARESLRKEMVSLVAEATEVIIGEKLDPKKDAALIERALKGSK